MCLNSQTYGRSVLTVGSRVLCTLYSTMLPKYLLLFVIQCLMALMYKNSHRLSFKCALYSNKMEDISQNCVSIVYNHLKYVKLHVILWKELLVKILLLSYLVQLPKAN